MIIYNARWNYFFTSFIDSPYTAASYLYENLANKNPAVLLFHILEKNQYSVELDGEACLQQKIVESIKTFSKTGIRPHMTKTAKQQIVSKNDVVYDQKLNILSKEFPQL